jgi:hypothetical protein
MLKASESVEYMTSKLVAGVFNKDGKKVKTITGTTNINGYFWKQFNKYCNDKGYTQRIENSQYIGNLAWSNGADTLEFIWETVKTNIY